MNSCKHGTPWTPNRLEQAVMRGNAIAAQYGPLAVCRPGISPCRRHRLALLNHHGKQDQGSRPTDRSRHRSGITLPISITPAPREHPLMGRCPTTPRTPCRCCVGWDSISRDHRERSRGACLSSRNPVYVTPISSISTITQRRAQSSRRSTQGACGREVVEREGQRSQPLVKHIVTVVGTHEDQARHSACPGLTGRWPSLPAALAHERLSGTLDRSDGEDGTSPISCAPRWRPSWARWPTRTTSPCPSIQGVPRWSVGGLLPMSPPHHCSTPRHLVLTFVPHRHAAQRLSLAFALLARTLEEQPPPAIAPGEAVQGAAAPACPPVSQEVTA